MVKSQEQSAVMELQLEDQKLACLRLKAQVKFIDGIFSVWYIGYVYLLGSVRCSMLVIC